MPESVLLLIVIVGIAVLGGAAGYMLAPRELLLMEPIPSSGDFVLHLQYPEGTDSQLALDGAVKLQERLCATQKTVPTIMLSVGDDPSLHAFDEGLMQGMGWFPQARADLLAEKLADVLSFVKPDDLDGHYASACQLLNEYHELTGQYQAVPPNLN